MLWDVVQYGQSFPRLPELWLQARIGSGLRSLIRISFKQMQGVVNIMRTVQDWTCR